MQRNFTLALAASAAALAATPALAQDADAPFSGLYVGGALGFDSQPNDVGERVFFDRNLDGKFNEAVRTAAGADAFSTGFCNGRSGSAVNGACFNDRDDISYWGRVGFDQQYGNIVVGVVGEAGKTQIADYVTAFSTTPAGYSFSRKISYMGSVRGRVGYAAKTTLFYGTFGPTYAKLNNKFFTTNVANSFTRRGDDTEFGYAAGGGVEQRVGAHLSFGLEYMFNQVNDDDYRVRVTQGAAPATNPFVLAPNTTGTDLARSDARFKWHSFRVTAGYRF